MALTPSNKVAPRPPGVDATTDGHVDRYDKPLFTSLWRRAWGAQYPSDVQPFSSCTHELLEQVSEQVALPTGSALADLGCGTGGPGL